MVSHSPDAANLPLYLIYKKLPKSIKVVLQGDGGDEVLEDIDDIY